MTYGGGAFGWPGYVPGEWEAYVRLESAERAETEALRTFAGRVLEELWAPDPTTYWEKLCRFGRHFQKLEDKRLAAVAALEEVQARARADEAEREIELKPQEAA